MTHGGKADHLLRHLYARKDDWDVVTLIDKLVEIEDLGDWHPLRDSYVDTLMKCAAKLRRAEASPRRCCECGGVTQAHAAVCEACAATEAAL